MAVLTRLRVYDDIAVDTTDPDGWSEWLPIHAMLRVQLPDASAGEFLWHDAFAAVEEAEEAMLEKRADYQVRTVGTIAATVFCPRCTRS